MLSRNRNKSNTLHDFTIAEPPSRNAALSALDIRALCRHCGESVVAVVGAQSAMH